MLPPLGPVLTLFRDSDSGFSMFNIAGFPGKNIFTIPLVEKSILFLKMSSFT
jgi:hypothetical protein